MFSFTQAALEELDNMRERLQKLEEQHAEDVEEIARLRTLLKSEHVTTPNIGSSALSGSTDDLLSPSRRRAPIFKPTIKVYLKKGRKKEEEKKERNKHNEWERVREACFSYCFLIFNSYCLW